MPVPVRVPATPLPSDEEKSGSRGGLRPLWWWSAAAATVAVVLAGVVLARPQSVMATAVVRRDVVRTIVLTGRVRPAASPAVGVTTAGIVQRVLVREGDRVSSGQLLVQLDDARARAAVTEARALLATARSQAESQRQQAATAVRQTERDLERTRTLYAAGALSARELEEAIRAVADARSAAEAANARGAAGAFAEVERARAVIAAAEAQLENTRVTAPAAATVTARLVDPGDVVAPGQPLLELATVGATELAAFASEDNLADLRVGAGALVSADAYPAQRFTAHIAWIAPSIDRAQGTVEVRLGVNDAPSYLKPEMTVSVNIDVAKRSNALVVPRGAVHDLDTPAPWVLVERGGRAVRRTIESGIVGESQVEVVRGLVEGERVLVEPAEPGTRIRVRD
ncbi:MAG TPA: efflux RND transporter periplasmic adaptor subunit [Gemmatimonadaceae bacterium]|nr:efflux RND transporter periplasmic adaptor subunit [Gemmatimonadaceae bacterium]